MKRFVTTVLLIAMLLSLCACAKKEEQAAVEDSTAATLDLSSPEAMYGHIDQTQPVDGVYKIWNAEGVQTLLAHPEGTFELLCDVDMAGAELAPIGEFTGSFTGGNFTIKNFTVKGGDETDFGFITVNKGKVSNLYLENVTLIPGTKAVNIGALVGDNQGTVMRCTIGGTMAVEQAPAGTSCGNLVGINSGKLQNTTANVDLTYTAPGKANVGGIAGTVTGGTVEYVEIGGVIDVTDCGEKSVGLFAGQAADTVMTGCMFIGASNTQDGKLFTNFTGNPDDDELVVAVDALWRDNYKEPLTEGQAKLRDLVVEEMNKMGTVEWRLHEDLHHSCVCQLSVCHGVYNTTYTYYGIPYNHKGGSYDRMMYSLDEDGYIRDWMYGMESYDGFDLYIGNDCSTALAHAWWRVSNTTDFYRVTYQLPQLTTYGNYNTPDGTSGCIPVGDYFYDFTLPSGYLTETYLQYNTEQELLECYAQMRRGDGYGYFIEAGGHTRMAAADPVVVRNQKGEIDAANSYLISSEQGSTIVDDEKLTYTSWKVNFKYSFASLLEDGCVPMTCIELITGEMDTPECTLLDGADGYMGMLTGRVKANFFLDSVDLQLKDSKGNVVIQHRMFTTVDKRNDIGHNDGLLRNYVDEYDLVNFAMPLSKVQLQEGETYTYTITGNLHTYDSFVVKEDSFTYGQI